MTTETSKAALEKLFGGAGRAILTQETVTLWPVLHIRVWGEPKMGKTHLGLGAETHALYKRVKVGEKANPFGGGAIVEYTKGELLLPSRPMLIGYANFDRDPTTVLQNLEPGFQIAQEVFYADPEGNPYIAPTKMEQAERMGRFQKFLDDCIAAGVDLFQLDGGTIAWESVREMRLPAVQSGKTPEGEPSWLPRQYAEANTEMRGTVMQRMYGLAVHTVLTTEAGQVWDSASKPVEDLTEPGGAKLRPDSWNKTDHYEDASLQMRYAERAEGRRQEARYTACIRPPKVGTFIANPTFGKVFADIYPDVPLLKKEDRAAFEELKKDNPDGLVWE